MKPIEQRPPSSRALPASGVVVPNTPRWYQRLVAWVVFVLLRGLAATLRYRWTEHSDFFQRSTEPVIFCVWHNRLALAMEAYFGYLSPRSPRVGMAAMVSASKDGALLTAILEAFKVQPVRGSSSRRGRQALLELTTWAERGYDLAITPDGPRGPCYVVQEGVMSLAQITGLPIIPFSFHVARKVRPNSWDRFQIPLPFSWCDMIIEKPIRVPRDSTDEQREELRQHLESTLRRISQD